MDADAVALVRDNWLRIERSTDRFVAAFHDHLARVDPSARELFGAGTSENRRRVAVALRTIIRHLDEPEELEPVLDDLGRRHAAAGIELRHFDSFERAMIGALEENLGAAFTEAHREAWEQLYGQSRRMVMNGIVRQRRSMGLPGEQGSADS